MKSGLLHGINTVKTEDQRTIAELDAEQNKLDNEITTDMKVANATVRNTYLTRKK